MLQNIKSMARKFAYFSKHVNVKIVCYGFWFGVLSLITVFFLLKRTSYHKKSLRTLRFDWN